MNHRHPRPDNTTLIHTHPAPAGHRHPGTMPMNMGEVEMHDAAGQYLHPDGPVLDFYSADQERDDRGRWGSGGSGDGGRASAKIGVDPVRRWGKPAGGVDNRGMTDSQLHDHMLAMHHVNVPSNAARALHATQHALASQRRVKSPTMGMAQHMHDGNGGVVNLSNPDQERDERGRWGSGGGSGGPMVPSGAQMSRDQLAKHLTDFHGANPPKGTSHTDLGGAHQEMHGADHVSVLHEHPTY